MAKPDIQAVVNQFTKTVRLAESEPFVNRYADMLLSDEADQIIGRKIDMQRAGSNRAKALIGMRTLLRRCRRIGITQAMADVRRVNEQRDLFDLLMRWMAAPGTVARVELLMAHPELYGEEMLWVIDYTADTAAVNDEYAMVDLVATHRDMILGMHRIISEGQIDDMQ